MSSLNGSQYSHKPSSLFKVINKTFNENHMVDKENKTRKENQMEKATKALPEINTTCGENRERGSRKQTLSPISYQTGFSIWN